MIFLSNNSENTVCFTLEEGKKLYSGSTYYLFSITHQQTSNNILFRGSDVSSCPNRYNQFNFKLSGSTYTNLSASTLYIGSTNQGFYNYDVYSTTATTLSISTTIEKVETGILFITGSTTSNDVIISSNNNNIIFL